MRLAAAIALGTALFVSPANADTVAAPQSLSSNTIVYSSPVVAAPGQVVYAGQYPSGQYGSGQYAAPAQYSAPSQNVFQRWMELERRKNAWIRQRLFGR